MHAIIQDISVGLYIYMYVHIVDFHLYLHVFLHCLCTKVFLIFMYSTPVHVIIDPVWMYM